MDLLRLATAGSVDDGKSTLIGRLLFDAKAVLADQLAHVEERSRDGMLYAASEFVELIDGEEVFSEWVRYRTVGDMSCTGAVASRASTSTIARSAVEAPVTMLRVYCAWPGVSAMMKRRRGVANWR